MYVDGHAVEKGISIAYSFYLMVAEAGHAGCQNMIGAMLNIGMGVELSQESAVKWWAKAAEQNHAEALMNLGAA